jgi:Na+-transporting methylmalonyl-CoA/oxaloacetate decarboxylase gamma subunit
MSFYALLSTNVDYTKPLESVGEKLALGGRMLLMGIGIVFSVLLLIWGALELFHYLCATLPEQLKAKKAAAKAAESEAPKSEAAAPVAPVAPVAAPIGDTELVAVITAAIAASENAPVGSFRVVSFRRV